MKLINYGISHAKVGDDNVESTVVKFGDGMTRISGAGWEKGTWGVQFARTDDWSIPFHINETDQDVSTLNDIPDIEKVYLIFDNARSVDALVNQLHDIKERMIKDNAEKEVK